jgi:hypothetical protein
VGALDHFHDLGYGSIELYSKPHVKEKKNNARVASNESR